METTITISDLNAGIYSCTTSTAARVSRINAEKHR